jgi:PEGA domain
MRKASIYAAALACLLLPVRVSSQMPQLARLIVKSNPPGAAITIGGRPTNQYTNAQFVVAPGTYEVSVPLCSETKSVQLAAGDARTIICNGGTHRWE